MEPEELKELKDKVESQLADIKSALTDKTDEIASEAAEAKKELEETREELEEVKGRLEEAEKQLNRPEGPSGGNQPKSIGEKLTSSDAYQEFREKGLDKMNEAKIGKIFTSEKGTLTTQGGSGSNVTPITQIQEIRGPRQREPRLRDLLNATPVETGKIEYPLETGFQNLYTELSGSESGGNTVLDVDNANGFYAGQEITIDPNGDNESRTVDSVDVSAGTITIKSGLSSGKSENDPVVSDTFEATAEANLKPSMDITVEKKSTTTVTVAHGLPITRQMLNDMPRIEEYVSNKGLQGLKIAEEDMILYGDGSDDQLQGIMTHNSVPEYKWSNGLIGDTRYDALRRAMSIARNSYYPVTAVVLHEDDLERIETQKDDNGQYVNLSVAEDGEAWGVRIVQSNAVQSGEALLGAFGLGATLYDREEATMRMTDSHKDYFMKNMKQLLIEERVAMTIERPESFVKVTFDNAPQA